MMIDIIRSELKNQRIEKELTQEALGDKIGVTKQTVSNWERGRNRIHPEMLKKLKGVLGFDFNSLYSNYKKGEEMINAKPLHEYKSLQEIENVINLVVDNVTVDSSCAVTLKRMLYFSLCQAVGYEIYNAYAKKHVPSWGTVAYELQSLLNRFDDYPLPEKTSYVFAHNDLDKMANKIEWKAYSIGADLFEDFDETGYFNDFPQQVGRLSESSGYNLVNILPQFESQITTSFKISLMDMSDLIECFPEKEDESDV